MIIRLPLPIPIRLPDMYILAGGASEEINLTITETLGSSAEMQAVLAKSEAPDSMIATIDCTLSDSTFTCVVPSATTKTLNGLYYIDFMLTNGGVKKKVARGRIFVGASATPAASS